MLLPLKLLWLPEPPIDIWFGLFGLEQAVLGVFCDCRIMEKSGVEFEPAVVE